MIIDGDGVDIPEGSEIATEEQVEEMRNLKAAEDSTPPDNILGRIAYWRNRNPRTTALVILALGVPATIALVLTAPYLIPALALTSVELFSTACVSAAAITGLAIREGVFRGATEEQKQWPGVLGKIVNWMRDNPKYTKAIAIPVVGAAVVAGALSGGLFLGVGVAAAYVAALGLGMFVTSTVTLYVLPQKNLNPTEASHELVKVTMFEKVKEFGYEHRFLVTALITVAVGATVLSGGLALGIGLAAALIGSTVVAGTSIAGLYAAQVLVKEEHHVDRKPAEPIKPEPQKEIMASPQIEVKGENKKEMPDVQADIAKFAPPPEKNISHVGRIEKTRELPPKPGITIP